MNTASFSFHRTAFALLSLSLASLLIASPASAETIIKLSLGSEADADVEYDGSTLGTIDDGNVLTAGDQNTDIGYLGFLSGNPDILLPIASFTLAGLTPDGPTTVIGGIGFFQNFINGTLELYDPLNNLLLSGALDDSVLTGATSTGSGGFFTTTFGIFTGGSLAPQLIDDSLTLSMSLDGANFSVVDGALASFEANAQVLIGGEQIPEPATLGLAGLVSLFFGAMYMRRRLG